MKFGTLSINSIYLGNTLICSSTLPPPINLFPNAGFEDGTVSPWYPQTSGGNDTCVLSVVNLTAPPPGENPYLEPVNIPAYDSGDSTHFLIASESDWSHINDADKQHFYVNPGVHTTSLITVSASGIEGNPKTISLNNGNDTHPAQLTEWAMADLYFTGSFWTLDRISMVDRNASSGLIAEVNGGCTDIIFNRPYTRNTNEFLEIGNDAHRVTVQQGYFDEMLESTRKLDGSTIHFSQYSGTDTYDCHDSKIIACDFKNQNDCVHISNNTQQPDGNKQIIDVQGLIIDDNNMWIDSTIFTNGEGVYDPNGLYAFAENAIDFKGGSSRVDKPMIITHNHFWGFRIADESGDSNLGDTGTCIASHMGVRNCRIENNLFFDASGAFGSGDIRDAPADFYDSFFVNNLIVDCGRMDPSLDNYSAYSLSVTEDADSDYSGNTIIRPRSGSGGMSHPELFYSRFVYSDNAQYINNIIVGATEPLETRSTTNCDFTTGNETFDNVTDAGLTESYSFVYDRYTDSPITKTLDNVLRPGSSIAADDNYAMKVEWNGEATQFAECHITGLIADKWYRFEYLRVSILSNSHAVYINETTNDNSAPILTLGYSDTEGWFKPAGTEVYVAIGDNTSADGVYITVDDFVVIRDDEYIPRKD